MYNIRFYKDDLETKDLLKNKIYKTIFDEIDEEKKNEEVVQISIRQIKPIKRLFIQKPTFLKEEQLLILLKILRNPNLDEFFDTLDKSKQ